jgi:hypothetical protein
MIKVHQKECEIDAQSSYSRQWAQGLMMIVSFKNGIDRLESYIKADGAKYSFPFVYKRGDRSHTHPFSALLT